MKIKKYQFVTVLLLIYALFMTFYFGIDLIHNGQAVRFWITAGAEIIVIILAYFALKKRDFLREKRKKENSDKENLK